MNLTFKTLLASLLLTAFSYGFETTRSQSKWKDLTLTEKIKVPAFNSSEMTAVAHALRTKKVAFLNFDVYLAELLMSPSVKWDKKPSTWEAAELAGVMMTFLRDVPAKNISEAFEAALKENGTKVDQPLIQDFLKKITTIGDIKKGEVLLVARQKTTTQDQLVVQIAGRFSESFSATDAWTSTILKIWSGKPADSGIQAMQKALFN